MNSTKAEFVLVGGHAVSYHGYARFTGDTDFFVRPTLENASRVIAALRAFGFRNLDDLTAKLTSPGNVIQIGNPPNRIDLLTGITGVSFDKTIGGSCVAHVDGVPVQVIGLDALLKNKRATGRARDIADADAIEKRHGGGGGVRGDP